MATPRKTSAPSSNESRQQPVVYRLRYRDERRFRCRRDEAREEIRVLRNAPPHPTKILVADDNGPSLNFVRAAFCKLAVEALDGMKEFRGRHLAHYRPPPVGI